ncbi:putative 2OG-Fe(II) oxygenase [Brevundimonas sp.]|uniref:2OG-Fe(II) oxygenase family protein n=1 Tax=Brevundimonas sp. TaxID=1871086 RepID=UPI0026218A63|nr:putative 2OG-Fe(II) oxygenase [Brevundimonas sp.]
MNGHGPESAARLQTLNQAVAARPASAVAEHNLAAALGDMGDAEGALAAVRRAFAKGGDAPETWLVFARALISSSRLTEAEEALRQTLSRRPDYADALRDQAQLIWMRSGDAGAALAAIDARLRSAPTAQLAGLRAGIMRDIIGDEAAYRWLEPWLNGAHPAFLDATASAAASGFDPALALKHAEAAAAAAPGDAEARVTRLAALMACGRSVEALPGLEAHLATAPDDQYAQALRYTAWRVVGDARALSAGDYRSLTAAFDLAAPAGEDRETWLADAAAGLRALHPFRAQPLGQSIRSGVQAALDPRFAGVPAIDAIFSALADPIHRFTASMAGRDDPMSRRAGRGFEIIGAWSVRLRAGGRHSDHIHPNGWVSSALYVETPEPSPDQPKAGWLRFGACRLGVGLELPPEHWIEPKPGRVALFPSWMWHGTEPFTGAGERLTVAFDVQPQ